MSCFNEGSYGKCVAARDSGVLQVCHFGASPQREPKLLTSCLWWSSQLQSFPGASRLLDLFSVSPWWKSQSILLVLSECACVISVTEQEQHPQAAIVSALAYSADCTWPRLRVHPCGLGKLQCITSCYICPSGRWKMFIWMVFPDSIGLWGELIVRGNLWIGKQGCCDGVLCPASLFLRLGTLRQDYIYI